LKQVVIKGLLGDADFLCCGFERFLDIVSELIIEASVKFAPQSNFLDDFCDLLLLVLVVDVVFVVLDSLLLDERLDDEFALGPYFEGELRGAMRTASQTRKRGGMLRVTSRTSRGTLKPKM
jgi:hypothetical protein